MEDDTLKVLLRLGVSSTLRNIRIKNYKLLNSESINDDNFVSPICQICYNMCKLETITIHFAPPQLLPDSTILEELAGAEKKSCQSEYIYVSDDFIQFWLDK